MAKYNWNKLKIAFINGKYKTLKEFALLKKIPYKTLQQSAVGWVKEKQEKDRENIGKIGEEIRKRQTEAEITRILSRNERVLDAQDKLLEVYEQLSVEDIIEWAKKSPKAFVSLTAGLVNLQKVHRVAEGLDRENAGEGDGEAHKVIFEIVGAGGNGDEQN